jgi:hypothetical protein
MAEVDTSIYGKLDQPANPLDLAGKVQDFQAARARNRLLQMELEGKQAGSEAVQAGIGPDGSFNAAPAMAAAARNPFGAAVAVPQIQQAQSAQAAIQQAIAGLRQNSYNYVGTTLGSMMANGSNDPAVWRKAITEGVRSQAITPEVGKEVLQGIAESEDDPAAMAALGRRYVMQAQGAQGAVPSIPVQSGAGVPGLVAPNAAIAGAGGAGGGAPPPPPPGSVPASGRPAATVDPQRPQGIYIPQGEPPPTPSAGLPAGALRTGLSDVEKNTQARITSEINAGADVGRRVALLHTLDQFADKFSSGPAAGEIYNAVKTFNQLTGANVATEGATAYDIFAKTARQLAQSSGAQFNSSDFKALETIEANPNPEQTGAAIRQIVHKLEGVEDLKLASQRYFQTISQMQDPQQRMYYTTLWDKYGNSPLPFQLERAAGNPKEQQAILKSLRGPDKKTVMNQWTFLRANRLIGGE